MQTALIQFFKSPGLTRIMIVTDYIYVCLYVFFDCIFYVGMAEERFEKANHQRLWLVSEEVPSVTCLSLW